MTLYSHSIDSAELPRFGPPTEASWRSVRAGRADDHVGPWLYGGNTLCEFLADHPDRDAYAWRVRVWFGESRTGKPSAVVALDEVREALSSWQRTP